jgi:hypothetical protein
MVKESLTMKNNPLITIFDRGRWTLFSSEVLVAVLLWEHDDWT